MLIKLLPYAWDNKIIHIRSGRLLKAYCRLSIGDL